MKTLPIKRYLLLLGKCWPLFSCHSASDLQNTESDLNAYFVNSPMYCTYEYYARFTEQKLMYCIPWILKGLGLNSLFLFTFFLLLFIILLVNSGWARQAWLLIKIIIPSVNEDMGSWAFVHAAGGGMDSNWLYRE